MPAVISLLIFSIIATVAADYSEFYKRTEGDIMVPKPIPGAQSSAIVGLNKRWPNGEVPYVFSSDFRLEDQQNIKMAMKEIESKTCIKFRPAQTTDRDRLSIEPFPYCSSQVGRQGGLQIVSLHPEGCKLRRTILHELLHALGFWHEQNRPDRDDYVTVLKDQIAATAYEENFSKNKFWQNTLLKSPYSYNTIMHYQISEFNKYNTRTDDETHPVFKILKQMAGSLGGADRLSSVDVERLNQLYCGPKVPPPTGINFQKGGMGMYWANGCNYVGKNIAMFLIPPEHCGDKCGLDGRCTHITWDPTANGGTCFLKAGFPDDVQPINADWKFVCGYKGNDAEYYWKLGGVVVWWSNGCDFKGKDIDTVSSTAESCGDKCSANPQCTHFTWTPKSGGTCILKRRYEKGEKPSCASGLLVCGFSTRFDDARNVRFQCT